jgi:microcystin-dependent protein
MDGGYIGEIRLFAGNFAPVGWEFCQGQLISIAENAALFSLLGTTYGGDGQNTFALPDLRSRVPIGQFQGPGLSARQLGTSGGTERIVANQLPTHSHDLQAAIAATSNNPSGNLFGASENQYAPAFDTPTGMATNAIGGGNSSPAERMPPYSGVNYIIALYGIYPSRN